MQILVQRCRDISIDVSAGFIDYKKAFDCVNHGKLINILNNIGLDSRDIRIIANLYWNQKAFVKVGDEQTDELEIQRGVRQGCVLSPLLFNLYSEQVISEALDGKQ